MNGVLSAVIMSPELTPEHLTPEQRLTELLGRVGWNNHTAARFFGCRESMVRRWRTGEHKVPEAVLDWLAALAAFIAAYPAPEWRTRQRKGIVRPWGAIWEDRSTGAAYVSNGDGTWRTMKPPEGEDRSR